MLTRKHNNTRSLAGLLSWVKLFLWIFQNRGRRTYGKETVRYLMEKYLYEYSLQKEDYVNAEEFVSRIHEVCVPRKTYKLKRIGRITDSGYFAPESMQFDLIISGGIGKNNDFEYYYATKGSKVVAIDPTIPCLPIEHPNIIHLKQWLSAENSPSTSETSIRHLIESYPARKKLLKIDIEGGEYAAIHASLNKLSEFSLIVVEFHDMFKLADKEFRNKFSEILDSIEKHFVPICFKSNNWRNFVQFGRSFVPEVFEVVFVNKESKNSVNRGTEFDAQNVINCVNNPSRIAIPDSPFNH